MENEIAIFMEKLDSEIQAKNLLKHEFYQAWSRGELSLECLKEYAKEYYQHVKAFPRYLSALHSRTEEASTRRILLQNLMEEEGGFPNHPELWRNFAFALGITESELDAHIPSPAMKNLISTYQTSCTQATVVEGIASLYGYESQIPEICISKIQGLKEFYGLKNKADWEYFTVHIEADKEHAAEERALIAEYIQYITRENHEQVILTLNKALDALWDFLSSMCEKHEIVCKTA